MEFIRNNLELKITVKRPPSEIYRVFFKVTRWADRDPKIKIKKKKKKNIFVKYFFFFCFKSIELSNLNGAQALGYRFQIN